MEKRRGFTLIELLVVIAIIALLMSVIVPSLKKAKDYAKRTICTNNARQTGLGIQVYAQGNDNKAMPMRNYLGQIRATPAPADSYMVYSTYYRDSGGNLIPFHLALLYEMGLIDNPESFYCPAQPAGDNLNYDRYTKKGSIVWGSEIVEAPGVKGVYIRTSYQYWTGGEPRLERIGSLKPLVFDSVSSWNHVPHRKSGPDSMPQGITVLYVDGHVSFVTDENLFTAYTWNGQNSMNGNGNNRVAFERILKVMEGH